MPLSSVTVVIPMKNEAGEEVIALDLMGVRVSAGAACSSGKVAVSHVLTAMGVGHDLAACALRASFGWSSTIEDVNAAAGSLLKLRERIRAPSSSNDRAA